MNAELKTAMATDAARVAGITSITSAASIAKPGNKKTLDIFASLSENGVRISTAGAPAARAPAVEASAAGAQREEAAEWEAAAAETPKGEGAEWEIAARGAGQENAAAGEPAEGEAAGREAGKEEAEAEIAALIDKKRGELKSEMAGIMRYPAEVRKICFECIKWLKNQEIFAEIADMDLLTKEQSDRITSGALRDDVYAIVNSIPEGCVLSYGAVAAFAGAPNHARLVGRLMSRSPDCVNAHRVVSSRGATAPHWDGQRALLELEGVKFLPDGRVDMKEHLWRGRARKDVQLAHC